MSSIRFEGRTIPIPEAFSQLIIEHSISNLGVYKSSTHTFADPYLNPRSQTDWDTIYTIGQNDYGFDQDICNSMVNTVLEERNSAHPKRAVVDSLSLIGEQNLAPLQLVEIEEENNSVTTLIYIGNQRFYVLATNRSTIVQGDIMESVSMPICRGEVELFNIYRNGELLRPKEAGSADICYFKTGVVKIITLIDSPELFKLVDMDRELGGELRRIKLSAATDTLNGFIEYITTILSSLDSPLPEREEFPDYMTILEVAKDSGINTFLCNEIISALERREVRSDLGAFNSEDWDLKMSDKPKSEMLCMIIEQADSEYNDSHRTLKEICKQVRAKRFLLFFKKSGRFSQADQQRADDLSSLMESRAKKIQEAQEELGDIMARNKWKSKKIETLLGIRVEPALGQSEIQEALEKSKIPPSFNLKQGIKVGSVLAVILLFVFLFRMSTKSIQRFDERVEALSEYLEKSEFLEAKQALEDARAEFKPSFLRALVSRRYRNAHDTIENAIDKEVENGINSLNTLLKATRGVYTKEMLEYLSKMLQWRPQNEELLAMKEAYMNN